ncbi:hypothetical protein GCM10009720_02020 [Yaniella flava]|uniref:Uncharacterized protein n=1 Tax=Yaniella flava TaxID=287930 RepID=A0ABP5FG46_9MICC
MSRLHGSNLSSTLHFVCRVQEIRQEHFQVETPEKPVRGSVHDPPEYERYGRIPTPRADRSQKDQQTSARSDPTA